MGTLAIDIETASPFEEPPTGSNDTSYYEWLSIAVAYSDNTLEKPETKVLFRRGGWDAEYTADLLDRLIDWCDKRTITRTLSYNGAWFDLKHMANWGTDLESSGERPNAYADLKHSFPHHIDLARAAADRHADELWDDQYVLPDFKAYQLEGIDNDSIWYNDYEFNRDYWENLGINEKAVQGKHVGQVLGEQYIDGIVAGLNETSTHQELEQLLYDYSISDIIDLFELYESLGAEKLDEDYHYPFDEIER